MRSIQRFVLASVVLSAACAGAASAASDTLVISQLYGGGGNSGATLKNDYIEILNVSASPISLDGYSLQYASSTGNFQSSLITVLPNFTLLPGHYFLLQEAAGA